MTHTRSSGIILHPAALPGPGPIGTLGDAARRFIDWLATGKQGLWQILPLTPTSYDGCPYNSHSAFAGNPWLIDPDLLVREGFIADAGPYRRPAPDPRRVNFDMARDLSDAMVREAFARFHETRERFDEFSAFRTANSHWLGDHALYAALRERFGTSCWHEWPVEFRERRPAAMARLMHEAADDILRHQFAQWLFSRQWRSLRAYANERGVRIVGDLPMFVAYESADVWAHQDLFLLKDGRPTVVAGVPPDYFSPTGQLWGNPLYDWKRMEEDGFDWWKRRFAQMFAIYDLVRIDHFRGFAASWAVPAGDKTAENGKWRKTPGKKLFDALLAQFGELPVIAEDLGVISEDVVELRERFNFHGMKVLQFAFDAPTSAFLPHNYATTNCAVYTGTHDNDTVAGWYRSLYEHDRREINRYLTLRWGDSPAWALIRLAYGSVARYAFTTLQDVLGMGSEARYNTPGTVGLHNWTFRFTHDDIRDEAAWGLAEISWLYNRNERQE
ncbi:MAG TPA: 4-alpha-glucanotransferase [bacterium]|nr:4-alpha-glucanotransferase [bacterium]